MRALKPLLGVLGRAAAPPPAIPPRSSSLLAPALFPSRPVLAVPSLAWYGQRFLEDATERPAPTGVIDTPPAAPHQTFTSAALSMCRVPAQPTQPNAPDVLTLCARRTPPTPAAATTTAKPATAEVDDDLKSAVLVPLPASPVLRPAELKDDDFRRACQVPLPLSPVRFGVVVPGPAANSVLRLEVEDGFALPPPLDASRTAPPRPWNGPVPSTPFPGAALAEFELALTVPLPRSPLPSPRTSPPPSVFALALAAPLPPSPSRPSPSFSPCPPSPPSSPSPPSPPALTPEQIRAERRALFFHLPWRPPRGARYGHETLGVERRETKEERLARLEAERLDKLRATDPLWHDRERRWRAFVLSCEPLLDWTSDSGHD